MEAATQRDRATLVDPGNLEVNNQDGLARDVAADLALTRAITAVNQVVVLETAHRQKVRNARIGDQEVVNRLVTNVILTSFTLHAAARSTCIALAHVTGRTAREKARHYLIVQNNNTMQLCPMPRNNGRNHMLEESLLWQKKRHLLTDLILLPHGKNGDKNLSYIPAYLYKEQPIMVALSAGLPLIIHGRTTLMLMRWRS